MKPCTVLTTTAGVDHSIAKLYDFSDGQYSLNSQKYAEHLEGQVQQLTTDLDSMSVTSLAKDMAREVAGDSGVVLVPHITNRLRIEERNGTRVPVVVDQAGRPSALTVAELKKEIISDPKYSPLVNGVTSNGVLGSQQVNEKTITRSKFDAMDAVERFKYMSSGGSVVDDPAVKSSRKLPHGAISRSDFDALTHADRAEHFTKGGVVVD